MSIIYAIPKDTNICDINPRAYIRLQELLDNGAIKNWRAFIKAMPHSPYNPIEVEKLALRIQRRESPTDYLLRDLGNGGKTVENLVSYLWILEHEEALKLFVRSKRLQITKHPIRELVITEGEEIRLECQASGFPFPKYQWFYGNEQIAHATDGVLRIETARVESSGTYCCRVYNGNRDTILFTDPKTRVTVTAVKEPAPAPPVSQFTAADKVALLIGNSRYINAESLEGVPLDIERLSDTFTKLGFRVISLLNLTRVEMDRYISFFCSLLDRGVYGVFYFGGHGFSLHKQTYLSASDAHTGFKLSDCVCAEKVCEDMQKKNPELCVLILDVCRKEHPEAIIADGEHIKYYRPKNPGNYVCLYATTPEYKAYDSNLSGVLWNHLSQYLPLKMTVEAVFSKTKISMGRDPRPQVREEQFAFLESNLKSNLSFHDPIYYRGKTTVFNRRGELWAQASRLPTPPNQISIEKWGVQVQLKFERTYHNQLTVYTEVKSSKREQFQAYITEIPTSVSSPHAVRESETRCKQVIEDLQQLKGPLLAKLMVKHEATQEACFINVNLGYPLIAQLSQCIDEEVPVCGPKVNQAGCITSLYSRVPTESDDIIQE